MPVTITGWNNLPPPILTGLGSQAQAQQNTTVTNDMSPDGYSWAMARPFQVDKYGNRFAIAQKNGGGTHLNYFTYANGASGAWADSTLNEGFLARGTMAYDSVNDFIHVLWFSTALGDTNGNNGVVYRRYVFTRDGSNNITDIKSDSTVGTRTNLVMDAQTGGGEFPYLLWMNDAGYGTYGGLLAVWSANLAGGSEVRASMCNLGATATRGQTAANWAAPVTSDTNGIGGSSPYVAYSKLFSSSNVNTPYYSIYRKNAGTHANDLYFILFDGANASYKYRRAQWNSGGNNWSTGLTTASTVFLLTRAGSNTGYSLKYQLTSEPVEDTAHDCMYIGLATWKDNTSGDTWGYAKIDNADAITLTDIYSAGGVHSLYPTGDIAYDTTRDLLLITYIKTTTGFSWMIPYQNNASFASESVVFNGATSDIPLLLRGVTFNGKVPILLRDSTGGAAPYHGWQASLTWQ